MNQQRTTGKGVFTVLLTNGTEICHKYDVPSTDKVSKKFLGRMAKMIFAGLGQRTPPVLIFENPCIIYNIDNVLGVQCNYVSPKKLKELTEELNKRMGFAKQGLEFAEPKLAFLSANKLFRYNPANLQLVS